MAGDDPLRKRIHTFDQEAQNEKLKRRYRLVMAENMTLKGVLMVVAKRGPIEIPQSEAQTININASLDISVNPISGKLTVAYSEAEDAENPSNP